MIQDYTFICLSIFPDLDHMRPDRRVIMLFAPPFTDMNELHLKKTQSYYVPFVWFLCDRTEEMKHI